MKKRIICLLLSVCFFVCLLVPGAPFVYAVNKFEIKAKIDETRQKQLELEQQKIDKQNALKATLENVQEKKILREQFDNTLAEYKTDYYQKVLTFNAQHLNLPSDEQNLLYYDLKIERLKYALRKYFYESEKYSPIEKKTWQYIVHNDLNPSVIARAQLLWSNPGLQHLGLAMVHDAVFNEKETIETLKERNETESSIVLDQKTKIENDLSEIEKRAEQFKNELDTYEATLRAIIDYKILPPKGTVVFAWPTKEPFVTQHFGLTADSKNLYQSGKHNGADFRAKFEPVYAMDDAVVEGIGDTDLSCPGASFGKWVFLYHPTNLASAYGHLSKIFVKKGQYVKKGDMIGVSGESGHVTGPHLHVSVFAGIDSSGNKIVSIDGKESNSCGGKYLFQPRAPKNAYLNPLDYLPPVPKKQYFEDSHHD